MEDQIVRSQRIYVCMCVGMMHVCICVFCIYFIYILVKLLQSHWYIRHVYYIFVHNHGLMSDGQNYAQLYTIHDNATPLGSP